MADDQHLSVILVPDGSGRESRIFRIGYRRLRILAVGVGALVLVGLLMAGSWWVLAARALRVATLEAELAAARAEGERVRSLAARLEEVEERYAALRGLFGADSVGLPTEAWLPTTGGGSRQTEPGDSLERLPTSWPLSIRGFVTRPLLAGATGEHPGIDVAVPTDSYVRATGTGVVVDVGEDDIYGRYVVLDHGNGYRSRYAHASRTFVQLGRHVRRNEVIALSGSTGRSTAPHLHFEIVFEGEPVDPLSVVVRP